MRILLAGASGTVGRAARAALSARHQIVEAGRTSRDMKVDLTDTGSVAAMFERLGKVDAVVVCAGHTHFGPVDRMTPSDFLKGVNDKLMGQVNLVLLGLPFVNDGGSFTLTSGVLNRDPVRMGANAATVDGAIDSFVAGAAIEMPRGIRINAVSPGLLEDSVTQYDGYFPGHKPVSSASVGLAYVKSVEGALTGRVFFVE